MDLAQHRNLYNGDWGTLFWSPGLWQPEGGPYSVKAIHRFVDLLADSGVDTFLCSPATQVAWYPSKVVRTALDGYTRGDRRWENWMPGIAADTNMRMIDHYLDLLEAGVDWVRETARICRERDISPWLSIRMNDMHGAGDPAGNPINCPLFHTPVHRLKGTRINPEEPPNTYWQALNYEHQEVRDYMMSMIRELVMDYDFEGLELDWLRNPSICNPGASQETTDTLTAWIGQLRALTEAKARATGHPYPLGFRIPGQLTMLGSIGLDVRAIVEAGLVDFVNPSNFMQTSWNMPHDQLRADLHDIPMYGVIELILSGVRGYSPELEQAGDRFPCASGPALRGNAAGKLVLGAVGIEQYNFYAADEDDANDRLATYENMRADYSSIRNIHDLAALRGQPKQYLLPTMFPPCWMPPFDIPEPLPAILQPDWRRAFRVPMCAEPSDRGLELIVQVVLERHDDLPPLGVSFNGSWPNFAGQVTSELLFPNRPFTHHLPENQAVNFRFSAEQIREGWNELTVYNGSHVRRGEKEHGDNTVVIVSIELAVK
jgi:hypothetical protein